MLDEFHGCWFWLSALVELSLEMAWKVSISCVVNVLSWEESVWHVESVKLVVGQLNVVLNTITIKIIDFVSTCFPHKEVVICEVLWGVNNINELGEEILGGRLFHLEVRFIVETFGGLFVLV